MLMILTTNVYRSKYYVIRNIQINKCLSLIMFDHNYGAFVVADACTTTNDELHMATLKNLDYGFTYIADTKRMLGLLER